VGKLRNKYNILRCKGVRENIVNEFIFSFPPLAGVRGGKKIIPSSNIQRR